MTTTAYGSTSHHRIGKVHLNEMYFVLRTVKVLIIMLICQRKRIQNHLPFVRGSQRISRSVRFIQCIEECLARNVPSGEERGETDVFAGHELWSYVFVGNMVTW